MQEMEETAGLSRINHEGHGFSAATQELRHEY
jgi:hypothetical protein